MQNQSHFDDPALWARRWAALELFGAVAVFTGLVANQVGLLATGAGILGALFWLMLTRLSLQRLHGPVFALAIGVSLWAGRPWIEGAGLALLLFSLLNAPWNVAVLLVSRGEVRKQLRRREMAGK